MHQSDFQDLVGVRLHEARFLLGGGCYDGAYYLAGYAVECALKASIAGMTQARSFPPKQTLVQGMYVHRPSELVKAAGMKTHLDAAQVADREFGGNWEVVARWSEESRYERRSESQARELYEAIVDPAHRVLQWILSFW